MTDSLGVACVSDTMALGVRGGDSGEDYSKPELGRFKIDSEPGWTIGLVGVPDTLFLLLPHLLCMCVCEESRNV